MAPDDATLISVPGAELHQVDGGVQRLLTTGEFSVAIEGGEGEQVVRAHVGASSWNLGKHLPALKAAPTIYSFGLEHTRDSYYCLILPAATPAAVLEAVEDVVASSCAFSNVRQVDAAFERADSLSGGKAAKEAEAIAAAGGSPLAGAGAGPGAPAELQLATATGAPLPGSAEATGYAGTPAAAPSGGAAAYPPLPAAAPSAYPPAPVAADVVAPAAPTAAAATPAPAPAAPASLTDRVAVSLATGLVTGSAALADVVKRGSGSLSGAVKRYAERQCAAPAPGQPARVSPHFRSGIKVVGAVASGACYVTGKLAALVGDVSYAAALKIAKALPGHSGPPAGAAAAAAAGVELAPEERSAFKTVGAAGLAAYVNLYDALEAAAQEVLASSAEASAAYIKYKYGDEAGAVASESVPVAKDMVKAATNLSRLGARAAISKTANRAAKIYLKSTVAGVHPDEQAETRRGAPRAQPAAATAAAR